MPPVFCAGVAVADTLVVLRWRQAAQRASPREKHKKRNFFAF